MEWAVRAGAAIRCLATVLLACSLAQGAAASAEAESRVRQCREWEASADYNKVNPAYASTAAGDLARHYRASARYVTARRAGEPATPPQPPRVSWSEFVRLSEEMWRTLDASYFGPAIRAIFLDTVPAETRRVLVVTWPAGDRDDPDYQLQTAERYQAAAAAWMDMESHIRAANHTIGQMCASARVEVDRARAEAERAARERAEAQRRARRETGSTGGSGPGSAAGDEARRAGRDTQASGRTGRRGDGEGPSQDASSTAAGSAEAARAEIAAGFDAEAIQAAAQERPTGAGAEYGSALGLLAFVGRGGGSDDGGDPTEVGGSVMGADGWIGMLYAGLVTAGVSGGLVLVDVANKRQLERLTRESRHWHEALARACGEGDDDACRRAVRLQRQVSDLTRDARDRHLSSPLLGFGDVFGPAQEWRYALGFVGDRRSTVQPGNPGLLLAGTMTGGRLETVFRTRLFRMSFAYTQLAGDLVDDDQLAPLRIRDSRAHGLAVAEAGMGLQAAQGLLSPYLELRARQSWLTGEYQMAIDEPCASCPDGFERGVAGGRVLDALNRDGYALVIGNTFNFGGLFGTHGPLVRSLVLDASYALPLTPGADGGTYALSVGFSVHRPFDFSQYRPRTRLIDDPRLRNTTVMLYAFPLGWGLEVMRMRFEEMPRFVLSPAEGWIGFGGGQVHVGGMSYMGLGGVFPFGDREDHEVGAIVYLLGAQMHRRARWWGLGPGDDAPGYGVAALPVRVHYRNYATGIPLEVGFKGFLYWTTLTGERIPAGCTGSFQCRPETPFDGDRWALPAPGYVYAGFGF
jgi:hypothetical protein